MLIFNFYNIPHFIGLHFHYKINGTIQTMQIPSKKESVLFASPLPTHPLDVTNAVDLLVVSKVLSIDREMLLSGICK